MIREAQVLLGYLKLWHDVGSRHRAKQRMEWFARLKIDRTVLDLKQYALRELPIEWLKVFVRCAGAVITRLHVIDKRAPHYDSMMRRDSSGKHRSEEHTSELQSPYVISYAVFC